MNYFLYLVGNQTIAQDAIDRLGFSLENKGFKWVEAEKFTFNAPRTEISCRSELELNQLKEILREQLANLPLEGFVLQDRACLTPELIIMDMDSTLVQAETIDQIANYVGRMPEVSAITEAAMRGELDFVQSLTKRVAMLMGLDKTQLEHVHDALPLTSGAANLIAAARKNNCMTVLVSGGFTYFAQPIADRIGIDEVYANELEFAENKLTGRVVGTIVDAEFKQDTLNRLINEKGFSRSNTIAVGDGANDLLMLGDAGLGIAFHGKPKVQQQAGAVINHYGLEAIQWLLDW